jgi:hypothetical protein
VATLVTIGLFKSTPLIFFASVVPAAYESIIDSSEMKKSNELMPHLRHGKSTYIEKAVVPLEDLLFAFDCSDSILEDEEYRVYSDAFPYLIKLSSQDNAIIIFDQTLILDPHRFQDPLDSFVQPVRSKLEKGFIKRFIGANERSCKIENKFNYHSPTILLSKEEIECMFKAPGDKVCVKGWDNFYKKYPHSDGIISLSRVEFNRDRNIALFVYGIQKRFLDGAGFFVLLEKKNNTWIIITTGGGWVSQGFVENQIHCLLFSPNFC